jgi:serine/threonine-protein kinase
LGSADFGAGVNLFWQFADGTGEAERLTDGMSQQMPTDLSPDGTHILFHDNVAGAPDIQVLALEGGRRVQALIKTQFNERNAVISPNARWIAYESNASGRYEVYARPFPNVSTGQWQVSTTGGARPVWSHNGSELFYVSQEGLMRVPVERGTTWTAGVPARLLTGPYYLGDAGNALPTYDLSLDDRRFLMIKEDATATAQASGPSLIVVQNWLEEVRRLVPTK